jgi:hypothetical protein
MIQISRLVNDASSTTLCQSQDGASIDDVLLFFSSARQAERSRGSIWRPCARPTTLAK